MKKLLAMLAAGGLLALTTGCPPAPSSPPPSTPPKAEVHDKDKASADKASVEVHDKDKGSATSDKEKVTPPKDDKITPPKDDKITPPKDDKVTPPKDDKITPPKDDKTTVTTDKETTVSGKVVSVEKDKLTLSVDGKDKVITVPAGAKVTVDDKEGALDGVKKDETATVTMKGDTVTKVEVKK